MKNKVLFFDITAYYIVLIEVMRREALMQVNTFQNAVVALNAVK